MENNMIIEFGQKRCLLKMMESYEFIWYTRQL